MAELGVTYENEQQVSTCRTRHDVHVGFFGRNEEQREMRLLSITARLDGEVRARG